MVNINKVYRSESDFLLSEEHLNGTEMISVREYIVFSDENKVFLLISSNDRLIRNFNPFNFNIVGEIVPSDSDELVLKFIDNLSGTEIIKKGEFKSSGQELVLAENNENTIRYNLYDLK